MALKIRLIQNGQVVSPTDRILHRMDSRLHPDFSVIIGPGQTREIPVRVSAQGDRLTTFDSVYTIEEWALYSLEVQLEPYFGSFTRETADKTLSEFRIPNYLRETLVANTMIIRAR